MSVSVYFDSRHNLDSGVSLSDAPGKVRVGFRHWVCLVPETRPEGVTRNREGTGLGYAPKNTK